MPRNCSFRAADRIPYARRVAPRKIRGRAIGRSIVLLHVTSSEIGPCEICPTRVAAYSGERFASSSVPSSSSTLSFSRISSVISLRYLSVSVSLFLPSHFLVSRKRGRTRARAEPPYARLAFATWRTAIARYSFVKGFGFAPVFGKRIRQRIRFCIRLRC